MARRLRVRQLIVRGAGLSSRLASRFVAYARKELGLSYFEDGNHVAISRVWSASRAFAPA